jgi:hypothetical protein
MLWQWRPHSLLYLEPGPRVIHNLCLLVGLCRPCRSCGILGLLFRLEVGGISLSDLLKLVNILVEVKKGLFMLEGLSFFLFYVLLMHFFLLIFLLNFLFQNLLDLWLICFWILHFLYFIEAIKGFLGIKKAFFILASIETVLKIQKRFRILVHNNYLFIRRVTAKILLAKVEFGIIEISSSLNPINLLSGLTCRSFKHAEIFANLTQIIKLL